MKIVQTAIGTLNQNHQFLFLIEASEGFTWKNTDGDVYHPKHKHIEQFQKEARAITIGDFNETK